LPDKTLGANKEAIVAEDVDVFVTLRTPDVKTALAAEAESVVKAPVFLVVEPIVPGDTQVAPTS
jgi:hypothetical protein